MARTWALPGPLLPESLQEFTRLENFTKLNAPPKVKYTDLEEVISTNIRYNSLPMKVRADYIRVTDSTVLTPITIYFEKRDLQYKTKDNYARATVNIFGRITSISRRVITTFEDPVEVEAAAELSEQNHAGFGRLSEDRSARARHVPPEHRGQGHRGRHHHQLRNAP